MYKLCQVRAGSEAGYLHGIPGPTANREELPRAHGGREGKGSLGLDECDKAWEMAKAQLEKEPLSPSILPQTLGEVPRPRGWQVCV